MGPMNEQTWEMAKHGAKYDVVRETHRKSWTLGNQVLTALSHHGIQIPDYISKTVKIPQAYFGHDFFRYFSDDTKQSIQGVPEGLALMEQSEQAAELLGDHPMLVFWRACHRL